MRERFLRRTGWRVWLTAACSCSPRPVVTAGANNIQALRWAWHRQVLAFERSAAA